MTLFVDSSVWIDLFADRDTIETRVLRATIATGEADVLVADLVLVEVLQGTRGPEDFDRKLSRLSAFDHVTVVDSGLAIEAARNYQRLRSLGITIRKTIDTLIATRCILSGYALLYRDRDYDPFVQHLGLRSAIGAPGAI